MFFECRACRRKYGDLLYRGPAGHAPQDLCYDCWATQWALMEMLMSTERGDWRHALALFLLGQGFSRVEVARRVRVHRNTVSNWLRREQEILQKKPAGVVQIADDAPRSKYTGEDSEEDACCQ